MRINKFIAQQTGISRRKADSLIESGQVSVNGKEAESGQDVSAADKIVVRGKVLTNQTPDQLSIILNKPVGYVCSKAGQGNKTVYDLLPEKYQKLKTVGRLDMDSSGVIILTNDGQLANKLTHPRYTKSKVYQVQVNKKVGANTLLELKNGIKLDDGLSKFTDVKQLSPYSIELTLHEGRNRQIRRTFEAIGFHVNKLHRIKFGPYELQKLKPGQFSETK